MEEVDKECPMIKMGVSGWVFLLVPSYPGGPGTKAVKRLCVCAVWLHCHSACYFFSRISIHSRPTNFITSWLTFMCSTTNCCYCSMTFVINMWSFMRRVVKITMLIHTWYWVCVVVLRQNFIHVCYTNWQGIGNCIAYTLTAKQVLIFLYVKCIPDFVRL